MPDPCTVVTDDHELAEAALSPDWQVVSLYQFQNNYLAEM